MLGEAVHITAAAFFIGMFTVSVLFDVRIDTLTLVFFAAYWVLAALDENMFHVKQIRNIRRLG